MANHNPKNQFTSETARAARPATPNKNPEEFIKKIRQKFYDQSPENQDALIEDLWNHVTSKSARFSEKFEFFKYVVPPLKEKPEPLLVKIKSSTAEEIADSQDRIIEQMGTGEIDVDYGTSLLKALVIKRDSVIVKELEKVVTELKNNNG